MSIMAKELVPILLSCVIWGFILAKHEVLFHCDNLSLVDAIHKGSSKDKVVMHLLRYLWFFIAYFDIELNADRIAGAVNRTANHLYRNQMQSFFITPSGVSAAGTPSTPTATNGDCSRPGLDIHRPRQDIQRYYKLGSATSTWRSYNYGVRHHITFCNQANRPLVPTSESTLLLFVSYLASRNLSYPIIKVSLAGIRSLHVITGYDVTFHSISPSAFIRFSKAFAKIKPALNPPTSVVLLPETLC